jgi:hypothetical protein
VASLPFLYPGASLPVTVREPEALHDPDPVYAVRDRYSNVRDRDINNKVASLVPAAKPGVRTRTGQHGQGQQLKR